MSNVENENFVLEPPHHQSTRLSIMARSEVTAQITSHLVYSQVATHDAFQSKTTYSFETFEAILIFFSTLNNF